MSNQESFEKELQSLVEDFGWAEEKARSFLKDKVGIRSLQIDARILPALLGKLCTVAVPFNPVQISFLVPESRWKEFENICAEVMASKGGFCLNEEEAALLKAQSQNPQIAD